MSLSGTPVDSIGGVPDRSRVVLLVDDDPVQLKLSFVQLTQAGFRVRTTTSAVDALEMACDAPPEAVISDVLMGDLDGFALCRMLRSEPALARVPVVLVSAQFQEEEDKKLALVQRLASQLTRLLNKSQDSEVRYRALIENAHDAICVLSPDGFIRECNRRLTEILLYQAEQMVGHHISEFAAPGYERQNIDLCRTAVGGASDHAYPYPIRRADGKTVFVAFTSAAVTIDGQSTVLSIGRDVTESLETARKLKESEETFRSFIENSPDVVWSMTLQGQLTPEEVIADKNLDTLRWVAPEDVSHVQKAFAALLGEKQPLDVEYRVQRRDGEWIWVHNRATVVVRPDGTDRIAGVLSDITARKRLETQLLQSQKMEAVGQLTGGVAHDFNNILAAILANSHFLIEDLGEQDPRRQDAEEIKRSAERAASLTRQLAVGPQSSC